MWREEMGEARTTCLALPGAHPCSGGAEGSSLDKGRPRTSQHQALLLHTEMPGGDRHWERSLEPAAIGDAFHQTPSRSSASPPVVVGRGAGGLDPRARLGVPGTLLVVTAGRAADSRGQRPGCCQTQEMNDPVPRATWPRLGPGLRPPLRFLLPPHRTLCRTRGVCMSALGVGGCECTVGGCVCVHHGRAQTPDLSSPTCWCP